jgi:hypothetical protein
MGSAANIGIINTTPKQLRVADQYKQAYDSRDDGFNGECMRV